MRAAGPAHADLRPEARSPRTRLDSLTAGRGRAGTGKALAGVLLLLVTLLSAPAALAQVPPDARWYTFETEHFRVHFTEGLIPIARRAADRAERAYATLEAEFVRPPEGRIELVLSDNVDYANGSAAPFPRNRIIAYVQPPASELALAYHDDWLELLLLHELVHIFHFDYAESVWQPLRRVFGRDPFLFPQIYSPGWVVEGLGTYFESRLTSAGRVRGSQYAMILRTAILEDAFFGIDQASLDPVAWPGASTRYVYGSLFIDHLARRHGPASVPDFVAALGRQLIPYRIESAARSAFGSTLSREWQIWEDSLRAEYTALADSLAAFGVTRPEILTRAGRLAHNPRFSPDGSHIAYAASTGRDEAAIMLIGPDGSERTVQERSSIGPPAWIGEDHLIHAQLDFADPYRVFSDLHTTTTAGRDARITRRARVWEPHPRPGRREVVAVASAEGTNRLVRVDFGSGEVTPLTERSLDVYWAEPRWSPRGDRIAASRWTAGGFFDVVVLDTTGAVLHEVTADRAIDSSPAWTPDGRYLVFASDRTGIPNLFAHDVEAARTWQITNVLTGAFQPDVSPDGRTVAFSYYRSDGYYIARIPLDPASWREVRTERRVTPPPSGIVDDLRAERGGRVRPYSAWSTVLPTRWTVLLGGDTDTGLGAGIGLGGNDVIERHLWELHAIGYPTESRVDAAAAYSYRGLGRPVLDLAADQQWGVQIAAGDEGTDLMRRDREASATLSWTFPGWRSSRFIEAGADARDVDFLWRDGDGDGGAGGETPVRRFPLDLGIRLGAGYSSVRGYGLSLGAQEGFSTSGVLQARRFVEAPSWDPGARDYWRATTRTRFYRGLDWYGFAPPVLALRVDAGVETEAATPGFSIGGTAGSVSTSGLELHARGITYPIRGFAPGTQRGNRVVSASAEYRFPLLLVERGFRLLPIALDRLWGDVFLDAGTAWCPEPCAGSPTRAANDPAPLVSVGAEAILELRVGYLADLPLRAGVALPLRGDDLPTPQLYFRLGTSF